MKKFIITIILLLLVSVLGFAHYSRNGDVNCNGRVTITDLVILSRYLAELDDLPCPRNADINRDGVIDILDLVKLQRKLAGLE
jgi:hypothetical protein